MYEVCFKKVHRPLDFPAPPLGSRFNGPAHLTRRRSPVATKANTLTRDQTITLGEMRSSGVRGLLI